MTHVSEGKCGKRPDIFTIPFPKTELQFKTHSQINCEWCTTLPVLRCLKYMT